MTNQNEEFGGWCILELLGHRRLSGFVTEEERFGTKLIRIDVPGPDGTTATQYYSSAALYAMTPTTEEIARAVALRNQPAPVSRYELPAPKAQAEPAEWSDGEVAAFAERAYEDDD